MPHDALDALRPKSRFRAVRAGLRGDAPPGHIVGGRGDARRERWHGSLRSSWRPAPVPRL